MRKDADPLNWRMRSNTDRMKLEDSTHSSSFSRTSRTSGNRQSASHSDPRGSAGSPPARDPESGRPDLASRQNDTSTNAQTGSGPGQRDSAGDTITDTQPSRPEAQTAGVHDASPSQNSRSYAGDSSTQEARGAQLGRPEAMDTDLEAPLLGDTGRGDFDDDQKGRASGPPGPDANSSSRQSSLLQSSANLANTVVGAGNFELKTPWLRLKWGCVVHLPYMCRYHVAPPCNCCAGRCFWIWSACAGLPAGATVTGQVDQVDLHLLHSSQLNSCSTFQKCCQLLIPPVLASIWQMPTAFNRQHPNRPNQQWRIPGLMPASILRRHPDQCNFQTLFKQ